jgi:hypothetical protein
MLTPTDAIISECAPPVVDLSFLRFLPHGAYASSRTSSLALAYMPRQHRRLRRAPLARSLGASSLNERLVCEPLSGRSVYEAVEPRQGMVLDIALVQPERKFIDVAVQMLRTGVMIDADQPALQDGKDAFDAVRRHVFANIFASAVIDGIVDKADIADARVRAAFRLAPAPARQRQSR